MHSGRGMGRAIGVWEWKGKEEGRTGHGGGCGEVLGEDWRGRVYGA